MPRVRANPTAQASPMKSVSIPLNDDKQEKAQRLQNRQAQHTKQMDSYRTAASPAKRPRHSLNSSQNEPSTPSQDPALLNVSGNAVTPMKRVPILANFEEWMKMATDNKINATNSWNFALIDYFHDLSLLKEGDGRVNFQKASCTLDGCVKIYTSRVDSVATETGKLLSGLAESRDKKRKGGDAGDDEEDGEGEDAEGDGEGKKKGKRKEKRSAEATLVNSFEQLRLKKMELEFSVDPLFKKASADFDEGGAKGLLLNHLSIDGEGRIVFDSSEDPKQDEEEEEARRDSLDPEGVDGEQKVEEKGGEVVQEDGPVDIAGLGARFFPDLARLNEQDICPTLKTFELGSGDASMDLPFLKAPENWRDDHPESSNDAAAGGAASGDQTALFDPPNFDNDDDDGGFDLPPSTDVGFGEGGEAWARDAALHPQMRVHTSDPNADDAENENGEVGHFDTQSNTYGVHLQHRNNDNDQENILSYFDNALKNSKNWAGPEHWKITKMRDAQRAASAPKEKRKEKEPFEIDFAAPMTKELASLLYTSAGSGGRGSGTIDMPKKDRRSKTRNLLPDDKHFNSGDLLRLFLKPKARIGARRANGASSFRSIPLGANEDIGEAYWASHSASPPTRDDDAGGVKGDYDANFFADDPMLPIPDAEDDDIEFADAREHFSPGADEVDAAGPTGPGIDGIVAGASQDGGSAGEGAFGANLIAQSRRLRPEYVQYARVAKKVDVRRLKEEMWRGIGLGVDDAQQPPQTPARPQPAPLTKDDAGSLHFVDIMNNLQHVYPKQQMADISTSYGFICLLHLANEKGLVIENVEGWQDLTVKKDFDAVVTEGDA